MIHEITDRGSKEGRAGGHFPTGKKDIEFSLGRKSKKFGCFPKNHSNP